MASKYWLKLYHEMLDDPKVAKLEDSAWRRWVECLLLAGEMDAGGFLPPIEDMAWRLRVDSETLERGMSRLALSGLVEIKECDGGEGWFVTQFLERQAPSDAAKRMREYRKRKRKETKEKEKKNTDTDTDTYRTVTGVTIRNAEKAPPPLPLISDEKQRLADMVNALSDVTGMSGQLNWNVLGPFAAELIAVDYSHKNILDHYLPGSDGLSWNWYNDDWRGRKGDKPRIANIRETISGAVDGASKKQVDSNAWMNDIAVID